MLHLAGCDNFEATLDIDSYDFPCTDGTECSLCARKLCPPCVGNVHNPGSHNGPDNESLDGISLCVRM